MAHGVVMHLEADLTIENWSIKLSRLVESSFIVRMFYKDIDIY